MLKILTRIGLCFHSIVAGIKLHETLRTAKHTLLSHRLPEN